MSSKRLESWQSLPLVVKEYTQEALAIRKAYVEGKAQASAAPRQIGDRKTKRIAQPPYDRPENVLARATYGLACKAFLKDHVYILEAKVRRRDRPFVHKPRNATAIDWAVKLVNKRMNAKAALGKDERKTLLTPKVASALTTELAFAFRHNVQPALVDAFIYEVGGYEIISAYEANGGYKIEDEKWLRAFRDSRLESKKWAICNANKPDEDEDDDDSDGDDDSDDDDWGDGDADADADAEVDAEVDVDVDVDGNTGGDANGRIDDGDDGEDWSDDEA